MTEAQKQKKIGDTPEKSKNNLHRSETDRILGGVCGGIANFFDLDSSLIRLIFILITIFGGSGVLLYLILWIILPSSSNKSALTQENLKRNVGEIKDKAQKFSDDIKKTFF